MPHVTLPDLSALLQVLLVDITLAGDNAVVVAMAAASLPHGQRRPAIIAGIGAATVLRILLAAITMQLLVVVGVLLAGGILLLWVCWKMYRELRRPKASELGGVARSVKSLPESMLQIMLADLSMSLDNVLAVAGVAENRPWVLAVGLILSVLLMGAAALVIVAMTARFRWIAWVGLLIVLYVAVKMILTGSVQVLDWGWPNWLHP